jgi:O-antigen ligase
VNKKLRVIYLIYILGTIYTIKQTHSQQGYLILLIGFATSLAFLIYFRARKLVYPYLFVGALGFAFGMSGLLNKGPLSRILYDDSIAFRGDYWRAGWNMTLEHPIFGVGLDAYGDWYRRSRSIEATLRRGPDITSNAAHNVLLDLSSYGGFPLALIYIVLIIVAIISIIKVIKRSKKFDSNFVAIVAGWVAYQVQSIVSINQIGLAIWGWILSGLIVGYEINTREP